MEASHEFRDVRSSIEGGHPEIQIVFDQERASQLGLTVRKIADRVVSNVRGDVATRYRWQDKKIDVLVRSVDTRAASVDEVRRLIVNPGSERALPLSAVADVRLATGPAEIRRANQERVAVISASPAGSDLGSATDSARNILAEVPLAAGITGSVSGQSEEMQQSFRSLILAFALAVFLVYLVMAAVFESTLYPMSIITSILLACVGVLWFLFAIGTTVDREAQLAVGIGGPSYTPMARAIMGGLLFGAMTSLFFVPAFYVWLDDALQATRRFLGRTSLNAARFGTDPTYLRR